MNETSSGIRLHIIIIVEYEGIPAPFQFHLKCNPRPTLLWATGLGEFVHDLYTFSKPTSKCTILNKHPKLDS